MLQDKTYMGDGAYAAHDGRGSIWLTTEDGLTVQNRVCLEEETLSALIGYARRVMHPHAFAAVLARAGVS